MLNKSKKKLIVHQFLQSPSLNLSVLSNRISDMIQVNENVIYDFLNTITEQKAFGRVLKRDVLRDIENAEEQKNIDVSADMRRRSSFSTISSSSIILPRKPQPIEILELKATTLAKRQKNDLSIDFKADIGRRINRLDQMIRVQKNMKISEENDPSKKELFNILPKTNPSFDFSECKRFQIVGVNDELIRDFLIVYDFIFKFRKEMRIHDIVENLNQNPNEKVKESKQERINNTMPDILIQEPPFLTIYSFQSLLNMEYNNILMRLFEMISQERKKERVVIFRECVERAIDIYWNKENESETQRDSFQNNELTKDEQKNTDTALESSKDEILSSLQDQNLDFLSSHKRIQWFNLSPTNSNILLLLMSLFIDMKKVMDISIPEELNLKEIARILEAKKKKTKEIDSQTEIKSQISDIPLKIKLLKFLIDIMTETNWIKIIVRDWNKEIEDQKNHIRNEMRFLRNEIRNLRLVLNKEESEQNNNSNNKNAQLNKSLTENSSNLSSVNELNIEPKSDKNSNTDTNNKIIAYNQKLNELIKEHRCLSAHLFVNRLTSEIGEYKDHVFIFIDKTLLFYKKNKRNDFFQVEEISKLYKDINDHEIRENLKMCMDAREMY